MRAFTAIHGDMRLHVRSQQKMALITGLYRAAQQSLARSIIDGQLSVRQAEKIASQETKPRRTVKRATIHSDIEDRLQKHFGTRIAIQKGRRGGKIMLHYFGPEELDRLIEMLLGVPKS